MSLPKSKKNGEIRPIGEEVANLARELGSTSELHQQTRELLLQELQEGREVADRLLSNQLDNGLVVAQSLAALTDRIVSAAFVLASDYLHPNSTPSKADRVALVAVGGYGRGQMAPFSDVDLLFLTPNKPTPWSKSVIESTLYLLWDLNLQLGHAVRSSEECWRAAIKDMTIRTTLLERRFIAGDKKLYQEFSNSIKRKGTLQGSERAFIEAKLAERDTRHRRAGDSRYLLEPDIKEGKGALRDLHTLYWIAQHIFAHEDVSQADETSFFSEEERQIFRKAECFFWAVRCAIQFAAGRAQNQLTFDRQVALAKRFGFKKEEGLQAVEHFMQRYYMEAKKVGDLTRIFCAALEAQRRIGLPGVASVEKVVARIRSSIGADFTQQDGRIKFADPEALADKPELIFMLFQTSLQANSRIHPESLHLVTKSLSLIDDKVRSDKRVTELFLQMLTSKTNPESALRTMSETGVLGQFIPEYARITGTMQFNMYHHYTVDEHTLHAIGILSRIERGELTEEHPLAETILRGGVNRRVLYMALLLHDIGKALPEDHSIAGEKIAAEICTRLNMTADDTESVCWLVRHHLLMSNVAHKRDISDPIAVKSFAEIVQSTQRLGLLLVLTVCDIRAVGPDIWNGWKAQLLRDLYRAAFNQLVAGYSEHDQDAQLQEKIGELRKKLAGWSEKKFSDYVSRHNAGYWLALTSDIHLSHARMLEEFSGDTNGLEYSFAVIEDDVRQATRVNLCVSQRKGIFSRIAGAFALSGLSVVDARIFTTTDGITLASYAIQNFEGSMLSQEDNKLVSYNIEKSLASEIAFEKELLSLEPLNRQMREFQIPTQVFFDNEASDIYTLVEVKTLDRPGLLYRLALGFEGLNLTVASAVISTYGERAVDVFYIKDQYGHKLHSEKRCRQVEARLVEIIDNEI